MLQVASTSSKKKGDPGRARNFVRAAEIWVPDGSGSLTLAGGSYGKLTAFRRFSEKLRIGPGQGLPGVVLEARQPMVHTRLQDPDRCARAAVCVEAQITAGLGIPLLEDGIVTSVVVLLCAGPEAGAGALEVWLPEAGGSQLGLRAGYYGDLQAFQRLSALMKFPIGEGLPGIVWKTRAPCILKDLGGSSAFIRAAAARSDGLTTGLGIPCFHDAELTAVVSLLSRTGSPVARVFEVWVPDRSGHRLVRAAGSYDSAPAMAAGSEDVVFEPGAGLPGRVWKDRRPIVIDAMSRDEFVRADAARQDDLSMGIAMPVIEGGYLKAVVLMLN